MKNSTLLLLGVLGFILWKNQSEQKQETINQQTLIDDSIRKQNLILDLKKELYDLLIFLRTIAKDSNNTFLKYTKKDLEVFVSAVFENYIAMKYNSNRKVPIISRTWAQLDFVINNVLYNNQELPNYIDNLGEKIYEAV